MRPSVFHNVAQLPEFLAAGRTLVRLFAGVNSQVRLEVRLLRERPAADGT